MGVLEIGRYLFLFRVPPLDFREPLARNPRFPTWPEANAAKYFMLLEFVALIVAIGAALGSLSMMAKAVPRPTSQMAAIVLTAIGLLGMFFFVWQR